MDKAEFRDQLVVLPGGQTAAIPPRGLVVGRDEKSGLVLADMEVSRRHALVFRRDGHVYVSDLGSRNGVLVNGVKATADALLSEGDLLQLGNVRLRFSEGRHSPVPTTPRWGNQPRQRHDLAAPAPSAREGNGATQGKRGSRTAAGRGRESQPSGWTKALFYALVINLVGVAANSLVSFLTVWASPMLWLIGPLVAAIVGVVTKRLEAERDSAESSQTPPPNTSSPGDAPTMDAGKTLESHRKKSHRVPVLVAFLVVLALGVGATYVVSSFVGRISGNESGIERLAGSASMQKKGLSLTVLSVQETRNFTRVQVLVRNATSNSVSLPLFNNAYLAAEDGTSLEADPFTSDWGDQYAPGSKRRGTINFSGRLPAKMSSATLSFATVIAFTGPDSITIPMKLNAVEATSSSEYPRVGVSPNSGGKTRAWHASEGRKEGWMDYCTGAPRGHT